MKNPIRAFIEWYRSLAREQQQYLAHMYIVLTTENTTDLAMARDLSPARFEFHILKPDFPLRRVARMMVVRSIMDLIFINRDQLSPPENRERISTPSSAGSGPSSAGSTVTEPGLTGAEAGSTGLDFTAMPGESGLPSSGGDPKAVPNHGRGGNRAVPFAPANIVNISEKQWEKALASWKTLRAVELSDIYTSLWLKSEIEMENKREK